MIFMLLALFGLSASAEKTFVYCSEASPKLFNPQLASDGPTFNAAAETIYNRLVEFKPGTTEITPALAEKWEVSKDGLTYVFKIRKGVDFHQRDYFKPTRPLNADDVVFSFSRMQDKTHPYHLVNGGTYVYYESMGLPKLVESIRKLDEYRVEFKLREPSAPFLSNLAMSYASILSKEYADALEKKSSKEKIDFEPIGTGPFMFKRYVKDNLIRFEVNPKYALGKPKIDRLIFAITPDPSVRFQKLKVGECHFVNEPSPTDLEAMSKGQDFRVISQAGLNIGYLAFNVEKKPFDNKIVRQAIHHALNRVSYIKAIYLGNAEVATNPIPPTMWSYDKGLKDYDYNPDKAKALLRQAGYPEGFEAELWTLPVSRPYNPNGKKMGELMQADLAQVGIRVKLVTYKWAQYLEKAQKGEHQMIQVGWTGDNGDPDNFLNTLLSCEAIRGGSNFSRWCDENYEKLILQARRSTDLSERINLYRKAQKLFKEEVPWVTLAHATVYKAMVKNVTGYTISPLGTDSLDQVDLK